MESAPVGRSRGSVTQRGRHWQARVYAGLDPVTGRRAYLSGIRPTKREAERLRDEFVLRADKDAAAKKRQTVAQALDAWLKTSDLAESTRDGYRGYIDRTLKPRLGHMDLSRVTVRVLEQLYAQLRRCRDCCDDSRPAEDRPGRQPRRGAEPDRSAAPQHDRSAGGREPHVCRPMAASTVTQLHAILSGAFDAAVRWEWMPANPAALARKPKHGAPDPQPPTPGQAARLVAAAWTQDHEWGMLVWLTMVTGARRGEICALRREHLDHEGKILTISRNYLVRNGQKIEKDTKTHQRRRISLDADTVQLLSEHWTQACEQALTLGVQLGDDAYLFSYAPDHSEPCNPDGITHRYGAMAKELGVDTHLHALRHFSATELIRAGIDIRTVAGRLGHGGGGAITLRTYAAWVPETDRRAAETLASRLGKPHRERSSSSKYPTNPASGETTTP